MAETNKTEKATPKKRKDERKKGNAFQSKDVVSVVVIILSFVLLTKLGGFMAGQMELFYKNQLVKAASTTTLTINTCGEVMRDMIFTIFICAMPILLTLSLATVIMSGVQTKFLFSSELLKFKFNRIDFLQGIKRLVSIRSTVELIKSLLKVGVIFYIIWSSIKGLLILTPDMILATIPESVAFMIDRIMAMVMKICLLFVGIAALDWAYQRYDYEKKLKMTKQEIKDEYKQTEGDPFIKGKIKEKQRKMSMNRMIQQVPGADVIIRNPTHFAVALKYDIKKDAAPIVVAKGMDFVAMRIIAVAEENNVLITENRPLARSLYESVDLNQYIPGDLYNAVAEVMAWVYSTKKEKKI